LENKLIDIQLNTKFETSLKLIGEEKIPVLVIDGLVINPKQLIDLACSNEISEQDFQQQKSDYYPGIRKVTPSRYNEQICQLLPRFKKSFSLPNASKADIIMSAFSITTTAVEQLRPIQMLPHFDAPANNRFAMVHYLCNEEHGGTSLYRHKSSGFERISIDRLSSYRQQLKKQAIAEKLHEDPKYIAGDTSLFEQIYSVEAKMNRAVIYPSNALHSGNIRPEKGLLSDPKKGRLTISSFILIS
jgi:hypothetical protein